MLETIVQLVIFLLVVVAAGVKSLRFAPSELTDFELQRQVKQGRDAAIAEDQLRRDRPLLLAMQQVALLLFVITIIVLLRSVFNFLWAIIFALLWLLVLEFLATRGGLRSFAEELADRYQPPILKVANALRPLLRFLIDCKALQVQRIATFYSKDELLQSVQSNHGVVNKDEVTLIRQALVYSDTTIKDIMTPRSMVVTVEKDDTVGPVLLDRLHKAGQSRFPVVIKNLDRVVGMLYMHDLVPLKPNLKHVSDAMRLEVFYVNQDKTLDHALHAFLRSRHHLFIVVNEFEEATGIISIEDILEQLIGRKIVDEFDQYEDLRAVAKLAAAARQKSKPGKHV